jgi:hypothetical protein
MLGTFFYGVPFSKCVKLSYFNILMNQPQQKGKSRYTFGDKLGEGTYGVVYQAVDRLTCEVVAIKQLQPDDDDGVASSSLREVAVLKMMNHPNIVKLHDAFHEDGCLYLVFEYFQTDLYKHMEGGRCDAKSIMRQLLEGLAYLHDLGLMHRSEAPQHSYEPVDRMYEDCRSGNVPRR